MPKDFMVYKSKPKKRFGQNFLRDDSVIDKIIESAELSKEDFVLEIGPGQGALTKRLIEKAGQVCAVEIDRDLVEQLALRFKGCSNFTLISQDILKVSLEEIIPKGCVIKVVANLPYYVTTPIIMKLLESGYIFDKIVVMVQKEVGLRMVAQPSGSDYGALTLAIDYYADAKIVTEVPATSFYPVPKVNSCVIAMSPKEPPCKEEERKFVFSCVKAAFSKRRKTLVNGLSTGGICSRQEAYEAFHVLGYDEKIRGEQLGIKEFVQLARTIKRG